MNAFKKQENCVCHTNIWPLLLKIISQLILSFNKITLSYKRKIWKYAIELETIYFFGLPLDTRFHLLLLFGSAEFNFPGCFIENFLRMRHPRRYIFKITVELAPNCYSLLPAKRPRLVILDKVKKDNQSISSFKSWRVYRRKLLQSYYETL